MTLTSKTTIAAVVVTYNRTALLLQCLEALQGQTRPVDRVVVVDNASTDGTAAAIRADFPDVDLLRLDENRGGAGGFHAGMQAAVDGGADWVWVMDDDAEPAPDALAALLRTGGGALSEVVALASQKIDAATGQVQRGHAGHYSVAALQPRPLSPEDVRDGACPITFSSFVGLLVSRAAIQRVGLPEAGFFIWGDDAEYSLRLASAGRMLLVPESRILHHDAQTRQAASGRPLASYWRHYYSLRNRILLANRHAASVDEWGSAYVYVIGRLVRSAGAVLAWDRHKAPRLQLLMLAFLHGVQNKTGAFVRPGSFPNPIGESRALQPFDPTKTVPKTTLTATSKGGRLRNDEEAHAGAEEASARPDLSCPDSSHLDPGRGQGARLRVLVLVVHYRNADAVNDFLARIQRQWATASIHGRVAVVDNSGGFSLRGVGADVATVLRPGTNLGYLNGCAWGRAQILDRARASDADGWAAPTWTWVCNTDMVFGDDMWSGLQTIEWPDDGCVLAPAIRTDVGDEQNPFMRTRPSAISMRGRVLVFSTSTTARWYRRAAKWKRKRRRSDGGRSAAKKESAMETEAIYAPHGSCMAIHRRFFEQGGRLTYPAFLYTEEVHVAEQVRCIGGRVYWTPWLRVRHAVGGTTDAIDAERRRRWRRDSLDAVYRRYFAT